MRTRNFRGRNEVLKRGGVTKSEKKERKLAHRGQWRSVFSGRHMDNVQKETHVVSVMTKGERNPQAHQATERNENSKNPSCKFWYPPVCQNYKSETGCTDGRTCFFRHVEVGKTPSKKVLERWCERISCIIEHSWVVYLTILIQENLLYVKREILDQNTPSNSTRARGTK